VPALLSGSVLVEQVFGVRGLGLLAWEALAARDQLLLLGVTTLGALLTLAGVVAADLALPLLDPRLRGDPGDGPREPDMVAGAGDSA
jgi:peptide/nickel transport system permease protein